MRSARRGHPRVVAQAFPRPSLCNASTLAEDRQRGDGGDGLEKSLSISCVTKTLRWPAKRRINADRV
jgi:hypothetical protein